MSRVRSSDTLSAGSRLALADPRSRIYLHCLDVYHYGRALAANRVPAQKVVREGRRAFRLSILLADRVFLPASSYFEGELAQMILAEHSELADLGMVYLTAGEESLERHREGKVPQYPQGVPGGGLGVYTALPTVPPPGYLQKPGSSREKIQRRWEGVVESGSVELLLRREGGHVRGADPDQAWAQVPDLLEERAFVAPHARELLAKQGVAVPEMAVSREIEPAYIDGYAESLGALLVGDLVYLASPFELAAESLFSYRRTVQALETLGLLVT